MPVTWSDEKLILLWPRPGIELPTSRSPWRQHDQGVLRANHSATAAVFNRYTCNRKKLYESVNMRVTYPTQGPFYIFFNTLCIYDMIEYSSVVFMFKVYNNQCPRHMLCFFERVYYDSDNHNTRKNVNNFKIKYCRTSQKASCISVIGPKLWNNLHSDLQHTIKECYSKDSNNWISYHSTYLACLYTSLYFNCTLNALYQHGNKPV